MPIKLPPANAVADMLGGLISRAVTAKAAPALKLDLGSQSVAAYLDESKSLLAVAYCDLPVGASLAAALMLVPSERVDECVKEKELDTVLKENLYEIFNVMASLFPKNGAPRLVLRELNADGTIPDDVKAVLDKPGARLDLDINVSGYRSGKLAILSH